MLNESAAVIGWVKMGDDPNHIIVMKVGPYNEMWKWYQKVMGLLQDKLSIQKRIVAWMEENYMVVKGEKIRRSPPELDKLYRIASKMLAREGVENHEIWKVDICRVGEGMEIRHLD